MLWYYLRFLISPTLLLYVKRVKIRNAHRIRKNQPILISMNHPNAFLDPIAFSATLFYPRVFFMARGDAFKKGIVSHILESVGIVPIFRLRDAGLEGVKKNAESFQVVNKLWNSNKKVIVFSEGLCVQERRLRPIQKGTARMAFGFLDQSQKKDFLIVPVSVTYSKPSKMFTEIFYDVGNPIQAADYLNKYTENSVKAINELTKDIEAEMKRITPHLNNKENDDLLEQLQDIYKKVWLKKNKLNSKNLEHVQLFWNSIIQTINKAEINNRGHFNSFKTEVRNYHNELASLDLKDHLFTAGKSESNFKKYFYALGLIIGYPLYIVGILLNFLPFIISSRIAGTLAKTIEFYASFHFVIGSLIMKLLFFTELIIIWKISHSLQMMFLFTVLKIVSGVFAKNFFFFTKKTRGIFRFDTFKSRNNIRYSALLSLRNNILDQLSKFEEEAVSK